MDMSDHGPLAGVKVVEIAGIGPGPFAGMMLADLGADVVCVDRVERVRAEPKQPHHHDLLRRGRRSVAVDLRSADGVEVVLDLVAQADVLIESNRPGVMERLGLGPDDCRSRNGRLIYARMTGWGQTGPSAAKAGHDINYIAAAGVLAHITDSGAHPIPPLNLVGDFGGGGMLLALGITAALVEAARSGEGQVIDCAMVDGAALLMTMFWSLRAIGQFNEDAPGTSLLDGGCPFYRVYECADAKHVAVGAMEPKFFGQLLALTGLADDLIAADQYDRTCWPRLRERLTAVFLTASRDDWTKRAEPFDACITPVLTMSESAADSHNRARATFVPAAGGFQPAPGPRYSRSTTAITRPPAHPGEHSLEVLSSVGFKDERITALLASGVVRTLKNT
jgi:alpha-methylacyl-CoA racemase